VVGIKLKNLKSGTNGFKKTPQHFLSGSALYLLQKEWSIQSLAARRPTVVFL